MVQMATGEDDGGAGGLGFGIRGCGGFLLVVVDDVVGFGVIGSVLGMGVRMRVLCSGLALPPLGSWVIPSLDPSIDPSLILLALSLFPFSPVFHPHAWSPDFLAAYLADLAAGSPAALAETGYLVDVHEEVAVEHAVCK